MKKILFLFFILTQLAFSNEEIMKIDDMMGSEIYLDVENTNVQIKDWNRGYFQLEIKNRKSKKKPEIYRQGDKIYFDMEEKRGNKAYAILRVPYGAKVKDAEVKNGNLHLYVGLAKNVDIEVENGNLFIDDYVEDSKGEIEVENGNINITVSRRDKKTRNSLKLQTVSGVVDYKVENGKFMLRYVK